MAPGSRGVGAVLAHFSSEDSGQTGEAVGEPRVARRSWSCYLSNAPGPARQLAASRKDSAREGAPDIGFRCSWYRRKACTTFSCKVLDLRETELGMERYGSANRGRQSVFGPLEDIFPIEIPARPGEILAIREFRAVHGCVLFPTCLGLRINLLYRPCTEAKLGFARYDLANRGRWNVPYAKKSFSDRDSGLTRGALDDPGVACRRLGSGCLFLRADTRENPGGKNGVMTNPADQEKTAFITPRGIYYYRVMPFGLKNAGATYQRMITKMFAEQLGKTVEVYIDDMVIKSIFAEDHLGDMRAVFNILRRHHLKLNASKCAFGVGSGKFLRFMVTQRGIEANPDQITAILNLKTSRTVREVQRLTGIAAVLNRSRDQSDQAFEQLKAYLIAALLLTTLTSPDGYPNRGAQLGAYDIGYQPRTLIKGQVLADFIAEFTLAEIGPIMVNHVSSMQQTEGWKLYIDGASNSCGSGLRHSAFCPLGANDVDPLDVFYDSQLVVNQISGEYTAKDEKMVAYLTEARRLLGEFKYVQVDHISRDLNGHADALASLASAVAPELKRIISVGVQNLPSVGREINNGVCSIDQSISWMSPILAYLKKDVLPEDQKEADRIRRIAPRICYGNSQRSIWRPYRGTIFGILCHRVGLLVALYAKGRRPILGSLPRAPRNRQWLIVATDYFTKWVEAEPLTHITDADSKKFIWKNIITRFGIPRVLVSDNGTQFDSGPFKAFCEQYGIRNHFSTPAYPQGNGQAESSNKTLLDGIKKCLEKAKGRWVEELPSILWTYRTTPRSSTGETPFSLTYGVEADLAEERRDSALIHLAAYQNGFRRMYEKQVNSQGTSSRRLGTKEGHWE
uniref:Integrase catalytic domain-containing protein n=1 Tax=Fagus sylvatica TaxID=28930 RepID=A0A2N9IVS7_FAGSY